MTASAQERAGLLGRVPVLADLSPEAFATHALQLARCHLRMGRPEDGRAVLARLLAQEPDSQDAKALLQQFDDADVPR